MLVPWGVTPPPIISAMLPVTTTAGSAGSSTFHARFIDSSVPALISSSARPVTTMGSSCGGSASV